MTLRIKILIKIYKFCFIIYHVFGSPTIDQIMWFIRRYIVLRLWKNRFVLLRRFLDFCKNPSAFLSTLVCFMALLVAIITNDFFLPLRRKYCNFYNQVVFWNKLVYKTDDFFYNCFSCVIYFPELFEGVQGYTFCQFLRNCCNHTLNSANLRILSFWVITVVKGLKLSGSPFKTIAIKSPSLII